LKYVTAPERSDNEAVRALLRFPDFFVRNPGWETAMPELRVLLVDDEEELVGTLAERLSLRGYDVTYLLDGAEAVRRAAQEPFDVLVLDVMMPGMNGLEVLKEIKRTRPEMPVILLTGRGSEQDSQTGLELGAFDYIMKPVKIDRLIEIMLKAVGSND
jgi:DNA-binding response OmpR family regulator